MLRVIVLGAAAGGGVPQWNCGCDVCRAARADQTLQGSQTSIAVSADDTNWFLVNAAPDLRQQLTATPRLHPRAGALRHTPIAGVILTNGEVDAVAGLLSLREGAPFTLYAHERVLAILRANSIFNVLNAARVPRVPIALDVPFEPALPDGTPSGLEILPFAVAGKEAWYLEGQAHPAGGEGGGDTIGLRIADRRSGTALFLVAACARITPELKQRLAGAVLVFFDGTLWRDDEMIAQGLSTKTGANMGHVAMSGAEGAITGLADIAIGRRVFLHVNNSNPALLPSSPERVAALQEGWEFAHDGMEIVL
ncbi:pyrroloquinoline quinone biosynthesis protein PqqB [Bradyrhizobium sp. 2TAF24]|uniref:pyrroloquinoline quinone biosynthesis protein PqqB n=1 Tax=Bradyrhizobium sp. 2TAF24 TaxID=3233011 RepID=UPI003F90852F